MAGWEIEEPGGAEREGPGPRRAEVREELRRRLLEILAPPWKGREERVQALLGRFEPATLSRLGAEVLEREAGLTRIQSRRVVAAFALGRSLESARRRIDEPLRSAARVARLMEPELRGLEQETFHVLLLDAKHRLKGREMVSQGTLTASLVHPREVFRPAIRLSAAAVVVVHNHPSGDPEPSAEDLGATRRLLEASRLLGIPLLDHVVIGDGAHVSLRERVAFRT
jgi:DNA repair protein RadC